MLYAPTRPHIDCLRMHAPVRATASAGMRYEYVSVFDMDARRYLFEREKSKKWNREVRPRNQNGKCRRHNRNSIRTYHW